MTTIALNEDWDIFTDGDCLAVVDGCDEIKQCVKQNILAIPLDNFLGPNIDINAAGALIKSAILETSGVISLTSFSIVSDELGCGGALGLRTSFSALTICGLIEVSV